MTAGRATALGLQPVCYPLFQVRPCVWDAPDPAEFDAIMLTSANALLHGGPQLDRFKHLPAFAVGEATGEAAREAGFTVAAAGRSDVNALVKIVAAQGYRRIFHPCGRDRRTFDPAPLAIIHRYVYEAAEAGDAKGLQAAMPEKAVALLHSPRAARRLAKLIALPERQRLQVAAISAAVFNAAGEGWGPGGIATKVSDEALLALAITLCK